MGMHANALNALGYASNSDASGDVYLFLTALERSEQRNHRRFGVDDTLMHAFLEQLRVVKERELIDRRRLAEEAYKQGWFGAADWAHRDDLVDDVDSPAYNRERAARFAHSKILPAGGPAPAF